MTRFPNGLTIPAGWYVHPWCDPETGRVREKAVWEEQVSQEPWWSAVAAGNKWRARYPADVGVARYHGYQGAISEAALRAMR